VASIQRRWQTFRQLFVEHLLSTSRAFRNSTALGVPASSWMARAAAAVCASSASCSIGFSFSVPTIGLIQVG
jgi:ABC-type proline/glycine betaine transport system permease subunit